MRYWQRRNIELFSVASQMNLKIDDLLKMPISEYYMLVWTLIGYNKKMDEIVKKSKQK